MKNNRKGETKMKQNRDNSEWALVGKVTAALVGIGAVVGACYGIGNYIYNDGFGYGKRLQAIESQEAYDKKAEETKTNLVESKRLIDVDSCLRYNGTSEDGKIDNYVGIGVCDGLELVIDIPESSQYKPKVQLVMDGLKVDVSKNKYDTGFSAKTYTLNKQIWVEQK